MKHLQKYSGTGNRAELKTSQQKPAISEMGSNKLIEYFTDGMAILSAEGNVQYVAPSVKKILGYADKEILEKGFLHLTHPDDFSQLAEVLKSALANPGLSIKGHTGRMLHKNGNWRWIEVTVVNMLHDPQIGGIVDIFRDVTDKKLAEEKILQLNRLYAFISQVNQAISHSSDEKSFLKKVCNIAIDIGKFKAACIGMIDVKTGKLHLEEEAGIPPGDLSKFTEDFFDVNGPHSHVLSTGSFFLSNDIRQDMVSHEWTLVAAQRGYASCMILPLRKSGNIIGTFNLYASELNFFNSQETALLEEATSDISYALDILERLKKKKKTVEDLHKSEANLQAIFNSTSEGFILTDTSGVIMEFNKNAAKSIISNSKQKINIGSNLSDFLTDTQKENYETRIERVLGGETLNFDNLYEDKWFHYTISPVYDAEITVGVFYTFTEITEQKLVEKKLVESELFNKAVLSSLKAQITVINGDGTLVAVNKAWDDFAKANGPVSLKNTSVGSNYFDVCKRAISSGDDFAKQSLAGILSVFNKENQFFELEYPCHSPGEKRWFTLNVSPFGEDETKVVIAHNNITDKKIAENNLFETSIDLKKTLADLNKILDSSLDVICTINAEGEFINVSKACQNVWGFSPEELVGSKFMNLVYGEDRNITAEAAEKIVRGVPVPVFENRYVHKSGGVVPLLWTVNWDEQLQVMFCIAKDITEKKRLEKAIESERDQFYEMFLKAPSAIGMLKGANHVFEMANPLYLQLTGKKDVTGKTVTEVFPEVVEQGFVALLDHVYRTGEPFIGSETLVKVDAKGKGELTDFYMNFVYQAYRNNERNIDGVFFFINDITEQVVSKKETEKSERFFKGVIENSDDMITIMNASGKTIYASPAVSKKFGYTLEECLSIDIAEIVHPDDALIMQDFILTVMMHPGVPMPCPLVRDRKKDGSYIWVEGTLTNFLESEGINAIVANFRDITERKVAEIKLTGLLIELEAERTRLVTAQKVAKTGSWETDFKTLEVRWSEEMHRIYGTNPAYFKPSYSAIQQFVHPDDRETIDQVFRSSEKDNSPHSVEHRILTLQNIEKCVEENWTISTDEKGLPLLAIGTCQDITASKKAADKIKRSETKLKVAQLIAQVGSWEVDILANEHSWSDEFYRILGIDENVTPSGAAFLSAVHPYDRAMASSKMENEFSINADSSFGFRFNRKNGETGYAKTEWQFEFDSHQKPLYIYGILRDLTQEKIAENERSKMISDIIQRNNDLEQFSYIISHNLRSPVANIIGLTEELSDDSHSVETKKILGDALSADVKRLENVIADLNTILQTKREIAERKEQVMLSALVRNIKLSISDLIEKENVHIKTNFTEENNFTTIKSYLHSIFYNLISNSIKFRQPDVNPVIEISAHISQNKLLIVFRDNGSGVDLVKKGDQIFGLYKRFHSNTEGKGMGLYMVKTQVETLGGKITVSSKVNEGTEFILEFDHTE